MATSSWPGSRSRKRRQRSRTRPRRNAGCASTITRSNPRDRVGDLLVVVRRDRLRVEEAAGVVQLDLPRRRQARASAARICAAMAPRGTVSSSVFTHRSHITQRNGHSRLVRKTTAVGARAPARRAPLPTRRVGAVRIERCLGRGARGRTIGNSEFRRRGRPIVHRVMTEVRSLHCTAMTPTSRCRSACPTRRPRAAAPARFG